VAQLLSVAELIREHGKKSGSRCTLCNQFTLYKVGDFYACARCDTAIEDRQAV
jgi:hypothetical protein